LGEIVQEVSGVSYEEYIIKNILEPLALTDTRTHLPENLYGNELARGYSFLTREGKRHLINFFQAKGIKPAAGFSSNVIDLTKFAAWQFRLMEDNTTEILKPSTLKYMHHIHWTDPDVKITRGLGFRVYKTADGTRWIGHGGWCPGYKSILNLNPETKFAYSVMINAEGVDPEKYVVEMHNILKKVGELDENPTDYIQAQLGEYTGYYTFNYSEHYISTWEGHLVMMPLQNDAPSESLLFLNTLRGIHSE
jgi:CubicO group peptidase (beta-lactamase class C family)